MMLSIHESLPVLFWVLTGFLSGSIMYSYWIPKVFFHVDTRDSRDHNPGAGNVFHYLGPQIGMICLILDILKGLIPVAIALRQIPLTNMGWALILAAPVLGHAFSPFLKMNGGKAIAVSFGVQLGLLPVCDIVFLQAVLFVFFSVAVVIDPHRSRVLATFFAELTLIFLFDVPASIIVGIYLIGITILIRHAPKTYESQTKVTLLKFLRKADSSAEDETVQNRNCR